MVLGETKEIHENYEGTRCFFWIMSWRQFPCTWQGTSNEKLERSVVFKRNWNVLSLKPKLFLKTREGTACKERYNAS
ncbi:hypothetical protein CDAR_459701 [Caerostris darwini]|uniref:Uncharacterized protein n=1 Tax=Caerostris darwini TaxID=1538125 RepID=A0AAV4UTU3_9ARAC|nr:hypothetical protein CDAR_459701 [Caerostris darwini]